MENFKRRTWDQAAYERLALEREDLERAGGVAKAGKKDDTAIDTGFGKLHYADAGAAGPSGSAKAFLDVEKARSELDLDSKVGKIEKVAGGARQAGYHCPTCDRVFQDSSSLLDHMNSPEHLSRLGFSSQTARSSKEQVKSRLTAHIIKATNMSVEKKTSNTSGKNHLVSLEERVKQDEKELEAQKIAKAEMKKRKKKQKLETTAAQQDEEQPQSEDNPDVLAALGFGSFGGSS